MRNPAACFKNSSAKLPVPRFSGNFADWPSFYENPSLSYIQKFHFSKQVLPDGRYSNPRLQFMYNMNALYRIEPLPKETAVDLRNSLELANVCIIEFRRLHIAIDSCDHFTYFQICLTGQHRPGSIPWATLWK